MEIGRCSLVIYNLTSRISKLFTKKSNTLTEGCPCCYLSILIGGISRKGKSELMADLVKHSDQGVNKNWRGSGWGGRRKNGGRLVGEYVLNSCSIGQKSAQLPFLLDKREGHRARHLRTEQNSQY